MLDLTLQLLVSVVAIIGVVLNNHKIKLCFILWIFSNLATAWFHWGGEQYGLIFRDLVFLFLAIHGWVLWRRKP